jgi:butyryl-CoA dehydrogenase
MDLGMSKAVLQDALDYAAERRQFGEPILNFPALRRKAARDFVRIYGLDSIVYRTVGDIEAAIEEDFTFQQVADAIESLAVQTSMVKIYGSETLALCADDAVQMLGGYGFTEEYTPAGIYRDARIDRIFEGTNEINRQIITGYVMKETLMEQLPVREIVFSGDFPAVPEGLQPQLEAFGQQLNAMKMAVLKLFSEGLNFAGQDLRHHHQLAEDLADLFTQLYVFESTLYRVNVLDPEPWQKNILKLQALALRDALRVTAPAALAFCGTPQRDGEKIIALTENLELPENRYQMELDLAQDLITHKNQRLV